MVEAKARAPCLGLTSHLALPYPTPSVWWIAASDMCDSVLHTEALPHPPLWSMTKNGAHLVTRCCIQKPCINSGAGPKGSPVGVGLEEADGLAIVSHRLLPTPHEDIITYDPLLGVLLIAMGHQ
jgi:hypothetical protein